jgi:glycosyltransferase involved in cell wall biosynthesis
LRNFLRLQQPQIVHTHGALLNAWGGIAARLAGVPHLMSHDHEPPAGPWRERVVQRWAARLPDVAFVASRTVAAERNARLHRRGARILSLPTGVDLRTFVPATATQRLAARLQLGIPADAYLVGALGRLQPRKRADVLVDALPGLLASVPQAHIIIAGAGPEEARLAAQARALGVESRVLTIPWQRDVASVYRALDVFVTLGDNGSGRTLAEAMACGLPVVALRTPLHAELANETSIWVEPRPRAVAQALGLLARSVAERSRLGAEARTRAVRWLDVDTAARLLENAYAHSVGRTPRPRPSRELLPSR